MPIQLLVKVAGTSHEEKSMVSFLLVKSLWYVRVCFVEVVEEDGDAPYRWSRSRFWRGRVKAAGD